MTATQSLPSLAELADEFLVYEPRSVERYQAIIDLGRQLEPMPEALKTPATKVQGCASDTWLYPTRLPDGRLHFLADSNAAITKGVVALVIAAVQDRQPVEIAALDITALLAPFDLKRELSSNRTQGVPNMIALVHNTARRLAGA